MAKPSIFVDLSSNYILADSVFIDLINAGLFGGSKQSVTQFESIEGFFGSLAGVTYNSPNPLDVHQNLLSATIIISESRKAYNDVMLSNLGVSDESALKGGTQLKTDENALKNFVIDFSLIEQISKKYPLFTSGAGIRESGKDGYPKTNVMNGGFSMNTIVQDHKEVANAFHINIINATNYPIDTITIKAFDKKFWWFFNPYLSREDIMVDVSVINACKTKTPKVILEGFQQGKVGLGMNANNKENVEFDIGDMTKLIVDTGLDKTASSQKIKFLPNNNMLHVIHNGDRGKFVDYSSLACERFYLINATDCASQLTKGNMPAHNAFHDVRPIRAVTMNDQQSEVDFWVPDSRGTFKAFDYLSDAPVKQYCGMMDTVYTKDHNSYAQEFIGADNVKVSLFRNTSSALHYHSIKGIGYDDGADELPALLDGFAVPPANVDDAPVNTFAVGSYSSGTYYLPLTMLNDNTISTLDQYKFIRIVLPNKNNVRGIVHNGAHPPIDIKNAYYFSKNIYLFFKSDLIIALRKGKDNLGLAPLWFFQFSQQVDLSNAIRRMPSGGNAVYQMCLSIKQL